MTAVLKQLVRVLKIGAAAAIAVVVVRRVRGTTPPPATGQAKWLPLVDAPATEKRTGPVQFTTPPEPPEEPAEPAEPADDTPPTPPSEQSWVEPIEGVCPATHPIKGNAQSGIFHVPGGLSYDRTVPERCYADKADAEADDFRRAKR